MNGVVEERRTDLEYVERLELNVLALIPQEVHHHLEIRFVRDVPRHDVEVGAIEQNLAEELQGLPLGDVVLGHDQLSVGREELDAACMRVEAIFVSRVELEGNVTRECVHGHSSCPGNQLPLIYVV